ncbi:MAG: type II toxin-antitoxin system RelE/ParE family toxin [Ilumatobacteraceae bacterium]
MSDDQSGPYELRVAGPAVRQLDQLPESVAAAIVEFMVGALLDNPHRFGGALRRELEGLHSARRGAYRVIYRIDERAGLVIVVRIDHRATIYRPR